MSKVSHIYGINLGHVAPRTLAIILTDPEDPEEAQDGLKCDCYLGKWKSCQWLSVMNQVLCVHIRPLQTGFGFTAIILCWSEKRNETYKIWDNFYKRIKYFNRVRKLLQVRAILKISRTIGFSIPFIIFKILNFQFATLVETQLVTGEWDWLNV